ncbi:hypothetical protein HMPREF1146_0526 [Prevotella sp. MSX73]|uniref:Uncharacterized protein n=1 Tax=Segatella buccae ATCC 33574 TaxID=873513 RepID=E6K796_9BACT|nr:hypothetical protein HMPREF6485_1743 [Segatella buccae ATCC 33574]EJP28592.1 hypothetical protein HMPREF1146_0526 [Prevotella sp. MSX73]
MFKEVRVSVKESLFHVCFLAFIVFNLRCKDNTYFHICKLKLAKSCFFFII